MVAIYQFSSFYKVSSPVALFAKLFCFVICFFLLSCNKERSNALILAEKQAFVRAYAKTLDPHKKTIYLTFDDGPLDGALNLVKLADKVQVPFNFFLVGKHLRKLPKAYRSIIECDYIDAYNHTYTHASFGDTLNYTKFYASEMGVLADLTRLKNKYSLPNNILRLPGRNFGKVGIGYKFDRLPKSYRDMFNQFGYSAFGWDLEWQSKKKSGVLVETNDMLFEKMQAYFFKHNSRRMIILTHDQMFNNEENIAMLENFIKQCQEAGYQFDYLLNY